MGFYFEEESAEDAVIKQVMSASLAGKLQWIKSTSYSWGWKEPMWCEQVTCGKPVWFQVPKTAVP